MDVGLKWRSNIFVDRYECLRFIRFTCCFCVFANRVLPAI